MNTRHSKKRYPNYTKLIIEYKIGNTRKLYMVSSYGKRLPQNSPTNR